MTTVLLDSHVLHWWSAEPERMSQTASREVSRADELAVAAISWFELAWLAQNGRIVIAVPVGTWLDQLQKQVRTFALTPKIAATAVGLPTTFSGDPADRLIYATAIEHGIRLVTKDQRLRDAPHPRRLAVW